MTEEQTTCIVPPDREVFNSFIEGLELCAIVLESCKAQFLSENYADGGGDISYNLDVGFDGVSDSSLEAFVIVRARAKPRGTRRMCTKVDCTYRVSYLTPFAPDEAILKVFARNVEINAWPFIRELVENLTGRMSGPTLLLPLRKG